MTGDEADSAFRSALANEQFILQSLSGATISQDVLRVSIYSSALSSGLVALGFASGKGTVFAALAFTILPTVYVLGVFTIVRLVHTNVESVITRQRIDAIRRYWSGLTPDAGSFFLADVHALSEGGRYRVQDILLTTASVIIVVNSVLGGAILTAVLVATQVPFSAAVATGVLLGVLSAGTGIAYQMRHLNRLISRR